GRSSARETAARVAAGAIAKLMLKEIGIKIEAGISAIGNIEGLEYDFEYAKRSKMHALDQKREYLQEKLIMEAKNAHDSVGGAVITRATGVPVGLGEPLYYKLDSTLAEAMMGINAVKAVEIGDGIASSMLRGSQNNDQITKNGFLTNHSGGILGGISNGDTIVVKTYFKPTPSIFQEQHTIDISGREVKCNLKGRHDPCVAVRGVVVCEAMMALVLADMAILNLSAKIENLKKIYIK
ncbi:MAG: chorismate synthase, partial [Epsilonproteobacteria bacterium]|nr:chorismate synthase [Campylobacterota bacterium]